MRLTAKQEQMVREFIREVDESADNLPKPAQKRAKNSMRERLKRELSAFGDEIPRDEQVRAILQRCKLPDLSLVDTTEMPVPAPAQSNPAPAPQVPVTPAARAPESVGDDRRIWAGVCVAWADRLGIETVFVRGAFALLGLVMPPLAFLIYFGGYVELAARSDEDAVPRTESGVLFLRGLSTGAQVLLLFLAGHFVPRLVIAISTGFLPELTVQLGAWGWYQGIEWRAFWFALFLAVPMRLIATLPLRHDWDKTLDILTRLVVAMYAVLISFGIASGLAGAALEIIAFLAQ